MRAGDTLCICKPNVYEVRDLWTGPERETSDSGGEKKKKKLKNSDI